MSQKIEELAAKRRRWVEANRENGFEAGIKRLLTDLYPDTAHFIYELLQNAEDAHAQEVRFILHEDRIEFEHNGARLFSFEDVNAITSIGFSTKRDDVTNIGKFGVGFKAVFAYTETPEVKSGEFHFRIRDMVVPELDELSKSQSKNKKTRFTLPFNSPKKTPEQARREIERLLKTLDATTLLFLTHIRKIEYLLPDSSLGYIERIRHSDNRFEICVQHSDEPELSSAWFLKFDKEVQVEDEEAEIDSQIVKNCAIAVAFGLNPLEAKAGSVNACPEWELTSMEPGRVCIYFPAEKETSNLRFHLHAPFASTVARDSVRDSAGNDALRDHLADLLAESISTIRDQGLLTVWALAVFPSDKDNLPEFYQPLMTRLKREFMEQDLVPMKRGGHAAANGIFRGSKTISDLIDDDDMITILSDDYFPPIWAANPPLRNQREDNFLSMLGIEKWSTDELGEALSGLKEDALGLLLHGKDETWHKKLYEILIEFINSVPKYSYSEKEKRRDSFKCLSLVYCTDAIHRKGSECFFPTNEIENDNKFPRVAKGAYFEEKESRKLAREFLETIGVREVDEKVEIEHLLMTRYSQKTVESNKFNPNIKHIKKFIAFVEKHPEDIQLFHDYYVFKLESGKWGKPRIVYLDSPFLKTGLKACRQIPDYNFPYTALSVDYEGLKIDCKIIGAFAEKVGALTALKIRPIKDYYNIDYTIDHLNKFLGSRNIETSKLIWRTIVSFEKDGSQRIDEIFSKMSRPNGRYSFRNDGDSIIASNLKQIAWVPQKVGETIEFVKPRKAVAENLSEGFEFQTGWQWLKLLEFGQSVKEQQETERLEQQRKTGEYKQKNEVAISLGFDSPEEAEEMAQLKKNDPEGFRQWKQNFASRKERPTFPARPVANPERRQERLGEQLTDTPNKEYEKRERSVRITIGAFDPITWLRNQYTNEADQLVCQICKEEMPFRKRDGAHYFEKKEVLSKIFLPKEHKAQYLALCPLCAAKYHEFVKTDDELMAELREKIVSAKDCEIPISLGDEKTSIRFVETHLHDLKVIMDEAE